MTDGGAKEKTTMTPYDSKGDTLEHILAVRKLLSEVRADLLLRTENHDASKLEDPEKAALDRMGSQSRLPAYGSPEDVARREAVPEFLAHHYAHNSHHPQHFENGIVGMSLLDLIEMLADWKAAGARHVGGNLRHSLEVNKDRFGYSDEMQQIFLNTARELGWL